MGAGSPNAVFKRCLGEGKLPVAATLVSGATPVLIGRLIGARHTHIYIYAHIQTKRPDTAGSCVLHSAFGDCVSLDMKIFFNIVVFKY